MTQKGLKIGVIGGGPAGLGFALRASELNLGDITVFERFDDVNKAFCGEYVNLYKMPYSDLFEECVRSRTRDIRIIFIDEHYNIQSEKTIFRGYVLIESECMKRRLKDVAKRNGVEFCFNTSVKDIERRDGRFVLHTVENGEERDYIVDLVIGADGNHSLVRRRFLPGVKMGTLPSIRRKYYLRNYQDGDFRFYLAGPFKFGYGWVYPGEKTHQGIVANIGVGYIKDYVDAPPPEILNEFVAHLRIQGFEIEAAPHNGVLGNMIPFNGISKPGGGKGFLLVGDALGTVNAVVGGGVGYALESGKLAAEYISTHEDLDFRDWHIHVLKTPWGQSIDKSAKIIEVGEIIYRRNRDMFNILAKALNHVDDNFIYAISQGTVKKYELINFALTHPLLSLNIIVHLRPLWAIFKLKHIGYSSNLVKYTS